MSIIIIFSKFNMKQMLMSNYNLDANDDLENRTLNIEQHKPH